LFKDLSLFSSY